MTYIENSELASSSEHEQTISTYNEHVYTPQTEFEWTPSPYPSLTLSQRLELNKILHTGAITNNNVSTFSDQDIYDSPEARLSSERSEPEPLTSNNEEQKQNQGCCIIG